MTQRVVKIKSSTELSTIDQSDNFGLTSKYLPRGKDWPDSIGYSCNRPYKVVTISMFGGCYLCDCDGYLPISVGDIEDFDSIEEIFESPKAKLLQSTIDQKTYDYCSITHCGITHHDNITDEYHVFIGADESCNLACPTCRRGLINHTSGPLYDTRVKRMSHIKYLLDKFHKKTLIRLSANGDPLASSIMRPLLLDWQNDGHKSIELQTNGLLMKKLLSGKPVLESLARVSVSVDAGSKEVYEVVRNPGKFETLIENLDWLADLASKNKSMSVSLNFVLSALNSKDLMNYGELCHRYGFYGVVTKLQNWNTFGDMSGSGHAEMAVLDDENHPLYKQTIQDLRIAAERYPLIKIQPPIDSLL